MNEQRLRDLFADQEPDQEPPLPPDYLETGLARGRRAAHRRRVRTAVLSGVAVVAVAVLAGTTVAPRLGVLRSDTTPAASPTSRANGGGSYDLLVQRLKPGWVPSGSNLRGRAANADNSIQSMRIERWTTQGDKGAIIWAVELYLFPPGVKPVSPASGEDGPLEGLKFGSGRKVDPVRGMPAELLPDINGYTLAWRYPSGAHAVVQLAYVTPGVPHKAVAGRTAGTGFGGRTGWVARKVATNLRIDGTTPLRFPFTIKLPAGQHVVSAATRWQHFPHEKVTTEAMLSFSERPELHSWKTVEVFTHLGKGRPQSSRDGKSYSVPDVHGFLVQANDPGGRAEQLVRSVHIFGKPDDMSTWRPDPVR